MSDFHESRLTIRHSRRILPLVTSGIDRLRQWMKRAKLDQRETAELLKMDASLLSHIMSGRRRPNLTTAVTIEEKTGIPVGVWVTSTHDVSASLDPVRRDPVNIDKA